MPRLEFIFGRDMEGTATAMLQVLDDAGNHARYLTEDQLRKVLNDDRFDEVDEIPPDCGICVTCGAECSDDGTCEETCIDCGEHYDLDGDGYDGRCPACADAIEEDDEGDSEL